MFVYPLVYFTETGDIFGPTFLSLWQVAPYGELGQRFAVAKPKEVQRVRSRRCYWMVGSSTQGPCRVEVGR